MAAETSKNDKEYAKVINELQILRNEQRNIVNTISTLEIDLKEHKTVIDTLKTVDDDRKCFRLISGVLCERTVKDVLPLKVAESRFGKRQDTNAMIELLNPTLPSLNDAKEQLEKMIAQRHEQLTTKGVEINKFKEKHNIKIKGQDESSSASSEQVASTDDSADSRNHVLVTN